MDGERRYFCSSPALDWRLCGIDTISAELLADPILYSQQESWDRLHQHVNLEQGLGLPPPTPSPDRLPQRQARLILTPPRRSNMPVKGETALSISPLRQGENATEEANESPPPKVAKSRPQATYSSKKGRKPTALEPPAPITPQKRKSPSEPSPRKTRSASNSRPVRWNKTEDVCILKAIVKAAESVIDWNALTEEINSLQPESTEQTRNGVQKHWVHTMKPSILKSKK